MRQEPVNMQPRLRAHESPMARPLLLPLGPFG
jgi:hypothetical protein